jgi:hypothetical protein
MPLCARAGTEVTAVPASSDANAESVQRVVERDIIFISSLKPSLGNRSLLRIKLVAVAETD